MKILLITIPLLVLSAARISVAADAEPVFDLREGMNTIDSRMNIDADRDGFTTLDGDCDDSHQDTYPDAVELIDGLDNNCNGQIDEDR